MLVQKSDWYITLKLNILLPDTSDLNNLIVYFFYMIKYYYYLYIQLYTFKIFTLYMYVYNEKATYNTYWRTDTK